MFDDILFFSYLGPYDTNEDRALPIITQHVHKQTNANEQSPMDLLSNIT